MTLGCPLPIFWQSQILLPVHLNRENLQSLLMGKSLQLILWQGPIWYPMCLFRKTVRKSFYDNKNMADDRSDKWLMLYKMFDPKGLCVLVPGLYISGLLSNIFSKTICASHITC